MSRYFHRPFPSSPRLMEARRPGTCAETGAPIKVGDRILWDPSAGVAYGPASKRLATAEDEQRARDWNAAHCMPDANY